VSTPRAPISVGLPPTRRPTGCTAPHATSGTANTTQPPRSGRHATTTIWSTHNHHAPVDTAGRPAPKGQNIIARGTAKGPRNKAAHHPRRTTRPRSDAPGNTATTTHGRAHSAPSHRRWTEAVSARAERQRAQYATPRPRKRLPHSAGFNIATHNTQHNVTPGRFRSRQSAAVPQPLGLDRSLWLTAFPGRRCVATWIILDNGQSIRGHSALPWAIMLLALWAVINRPFTPQCDCNVGGPVMDMKRVMGDTRSSDC
jgi:hypothetical protein